jgi:iron complex transport system permease protein
MSARPCGEPGPLTVASHLPGTAHPEGRSRTGLFRPRPLLWLGLALLLVAVASLFLGRFPSPGFMSPTLLWEDSSTGNLARQLLFNLRLPRLLTAVLLGMTLAASGTVLQMIFRNPLVEPGLLGVSQGAAFGAALSIVFLGASVLMMEIMATLFACLGLAVSYLLARRLRYGGWILRLLLSGIAVSALFSSGVGLLKYLADPLTELPGIVFWMLGGLWGVTWSDLLYLLLPVTAGLAVVLLMRWRLNLLSLDDDTAASLGASPVLERTLLLVASVAATAAVVAVAGIIGWVGLLIPHVARRLMGADAQRALPASILLGGTFTLLCDDLARTLLAGEIPLGILASFFGALLFLVLMATRSVKVRR